ncbi:WD40 repeat domain-containing protein [Streptomyces sp. NPDC005485]|uniref:WD40 repeat domain-containing protein n=1 Tax=Streptomyces sp. NPDC005485 TaxID=3155591 RepID=UPI0033A16EEE
MTQADAYRSGTASDDEDFPQQLRHFAADLRKLRIDQGSPTLRQIANRAVAERRLSATAVSEAFNAKRLPRQDFVMALVRTLLSYDHDGRKQAITRDDPRLSDWRIRWQRLEHLRIEHQRDASASEAPSPDPAEVYSPLFGSASFSERPDPGAESAQTQATGLAAAMLLSALERGERISLPSLAVYAEEIRTVAFSPDGSLLAVACHDVSLWDPVTRRQVGPPLTGHQGSVSTLAFSPNGRLIATTGADGAIWLWDTETRQRLGGPLTAHQHTVTTLVFSPDGSLLASSDSAETGTVWYTDTWNAAVTTPRTCTMAFSPNSEFLAIGAPDGAVQLRRLSAVEVEVTIRAGRTSLQALAFSPDGRLLVTAVDDHALRIWDTTSWDLVRERFIDVTAHFQALAFSPPGRLFATSTGEGTVQLWDKNTQRALSLPLTNDNPATTIAFSPDGQLLATGGNDGSVHLLIANPPALSVSQPEGFTVAIDVI